MKTQNIEPARHGEDGEYVGTRFIASAPTDRIYPVPTFLSFGVYKRSWYAWGFILILLFAGCIPAKVPPHLSNTPGPAVVVSEDRYDAGVFEARIPEGWRVITSPADVPPFVIFVAPDGCALMILSVAPQAIPEAGAACESAAFETVEREIALDSIRVMLGGRASAEAWDAFMIMFEGVVESVTE